ncbi:FecR domain-containing protein [Sphingomonas cannabina]|uniref:FecR family protein n=1 Tax=Sphingomonas cannabina TaxID=2899123 RepID=UPI001F239031|nr:FecR domain-containing protein [Sphingomonas cannabina]UIJ46341.1 FecR domain-containing protein [Sphingomonas cannabina]
MANLGGGAKSGEVARREARDWVVLIHDSGAEVDWAAFERWRAADPRHGEAYERAERAWNQSGLLAETSFGQTRNLPERRHGRFGRPVGYTLAAAAALAVLFIGLAIARPEMLQGLTGAGSSEFSAPVGAIRTVALDDGSTVTLDSDSALRVAFGASERRLELLKGRARFDVAHEADRPFIVAAGGGAVIARGTLFDVGLHDGQVTVTLLRGAVEVRNAEAMRSATPSPSKVRTLRPQQTIAFVAAAPLPVPQAAAKADAQWTSGMLTFDATRLAEAVAEINRYSGTKIVLADPAIAELRITGAYRASDTAGFARTVAQSLRLRVTRTREGNLLLSASPAGSPS